MYQDCALKCSGKNVIIFSDSSNLVFHNKKNRIKDDSGLIRIAGTKNATFKGLLLHTNLVFDEDTHEPLGNSHVAFVNRRLKSRVKAGERGKLAVETIEEKESYKWIKGFNESKELLKTASHITYVGDREADILELIDRTPDEKSDIVIRSSHDRTLIDDNGEEIKLREAISHCKISGKIQTVVRTKNRKKRKAKLEVRYTSARIKWPPGKKTRKKIHEEWVPINIIEVREVRHKGYKNEPPLVWRILTTKPINSIGQAIEVIEIYKLRWRVEEYFKLLKSDCYDIENTELTKGRSIRKLVLYVMKASIKIQQLKSARSGTQDVALNSVFDKDEIECLNILNSKLEGNTEKQRNPHPKDQLAYGSWVIARLGGWKEFYDKKRPPGTKTFAVGLEKFEIIIEGIKIGKLMS